MRCSFWMGILCSLAIVAPASVFAAPISFTGVSGNLAATVTFDISGSNLLVTLDNTSSADVTVPADVLGAVFFDITGSPTLSAVSAFIHSGSAMVNGTAPGGDVGGAWAYKSGLSGAPGGAKYGISSAGYGLFGPPNVFPGADPDPSNGPAGMEFGLLSAGDNTSTGNSPILSNPFTKHAVDFVLSGLPVGFQLTSISNVRMQYGTTIGSEPTYQAFVPEPATGAILALAGLCFAGRRRERI